MCKDKPVTLENSSALVELIEKNHEELKKIIVVGSDPIVGIDIMKELCFPDLSGSIDPEILQCVWDSCPPELIIPEIEKEENKKPRKRYAGKPKWPRK